MSAKVTRLPAKREDNGYEDLEKIFRKADARKRDFRRAEDEVYYQYRRRRQEKENATRRSVRRLLQISAVVFLALACIFGGNGDYGSLIAAGAFSLISILGLLLNG